MSDKATPGNTRPMLLRVLAVASKIRSRVAITAFDLEEELGVCHKTICRDIDLLKDLGAPIYYNSEMHTWIWNPMLPTPWYFGGTIQNPKINFSHATKKES